MGWEGDSSAVPCPDLSPGLPVHSSVKPSARARLQESRAAESPKGKIPEASCQRQGAIGDNRPLEGYPRTYIR